MLLLRPLEPAERSRPCGRSAAGRRGGRRRACAAAAGRGGGSVRGALRWLDGDRLALDRDDRGRARAAARRRLARAAPARRPARRRRSDGFRAVLLDAVLDWLDARRAAAAGAGGAASPCAPGGGMGQGPPLGARGREPQSRQAAAACCRSSPISPQATRLRADASDRDRLAMASRPTFYITTAIPYANGAPHIGHAYERIATDAIARFKRLDGYDVLFVTGMDEHGQKMQQTAAREGLTPQALADRTAAQFEAMGDAARTRAPTTSCAPRRSATRAPSQAIWRRMEANGDIYLSTTIRAGIRSATRPISTRASSTRDADGPRLAPTGTPVEWVEEESYFFRLSAYRRPAARASTRRSPDFVDAGEIPQRDRQLRQARPATTSRSAARPSTGACRCRAIPSHVMYVWVDALTNYLTGTGFPGPEAPRGRGSGRPTRM